MNTVLNTVFCEIDNHANVAHTNTHKCKLNSNVSDQGSKCKFATCADVHDAPVYDAYTILRHDIMVRQTERASYPRGCDCEDAKICISQTDSIQMIKICVTF